MDHPRESLMFFGGCKIREGGFSLNLPINPQSPGIFHPAGEAGSVILKIQIHKDSFYAILGRFVNGLYQSRTHSSRQAGVRPTEIPVAFEE